MHLEKTQILLKSQIQQSDQRKKDLDQQITNLNNKIKHLESENHELKLIRDQFYVKKNEGMVFEQNKLFYFDNPVDEFQQCEDVEQLGPGQNLLDLWCSEIIFSEDVFQKEFQSFSKQKSQLLSFITVDFYNHDTNNSTVVEGLAPFFNCLFSYKVTVDEHFIEYLYNNFLIIELYVSNGTEDVEKVAISRVKLNDLIIRNKNRQDASAVLRKPAVFDTVKEQRCIGTMDIKFR